MARVFKRNDVGRRNREEDLYSMKELFAQEVAIGLTSGVVISGNYSKAVTQEIVKQAIMELVG